MTSSSTPSCSGAPSRPSTTRSASTRTSFINARAMGNDQAVALLEDNLRQEQDTLETVKTAQANVAAVTPKQPA